MKLSLKIFLPTLATIILFLFCNNSYLNKIEKKTQNSIKPAQKHSKFNAYWYLGKAEITSYKLTQNRYGELHTGTAVNVYVTEDFLPTKQVKADYKKNTNIPILKLNSTKKFITGIYPYSLMTSTFSPINTLENALKISFSAQEWCGNTFAQLNNRDQYNIDFHSYFESNSDRKTSIKKAILENELWNILRVNPKKLPIGDLKIIPSFEFLALDHQKIKAYSAKASLKEEGDFIVYAIEYSELKRRLAIKATKKFPFTIESWKETVTKRGKKHTTKAEKIKTIVSDYWNKNGVTDTTERKELGL